MDHNQHDNASEQTLPSEHADRASNLSTRPNISEQNDAGLEDLGIEQRPSEMRTDREQTYPLYSERATNQRSHSFDQGQNALPMHYSAPPYLNQPRPSPERTEHPPIPNNTLDSKGKPLSVFDPEWELNLKQEEERREREQENHMLLNEDNEPLLSQKCDHDMINTDNESLLSQQAHNDFQDAHNEPEDPLITQHSEPNHELHSINESNEEARSEAEVSNQVKIEQIVQNRGIAFNDYDQYSRSQSSVSEPHEPLFETFVKDESQSILLKFGFTVDKKRKATPETPSRSQEIPPQEATSNHGVVKEEPMDIEYISKTPLKEQKDSNQSVFPEEGSIVIQVNDCNSDNLNSLTKNNDIYGINSSKASQEQENIDPRRQEPHEPPNNQSPAEFEWSICEPSVKIAPKQEEIKQQSIRIQQPQVKNSKTALEQAIEILEARKPKQVKPPLTFEQIATKMEQIVHEEGSGVERAEKAVKLLEGHVDLVFVHALSETGKRILSNGHTVVNMIKLILLKEKEDFLRDTLRKYLIITLASRVMQHTEALVNYQQSHIHIVKEFQNRLPRQQRNGTFAIINQHSTLIQNEGNQGRQPEPIAHPAIEVAPPREEINQQVQTDDLADKSVQAQNGSSTKKYTQEKMDVVDLANQPVKRTIKSKNLAVEADRIAPLSGKPTRKTRLKSKGKTTSKKANVKFQEGQSEQAPSEPPKSPPKRGRKKGTSRSLQKDKSPKNEEDSQQTNLGSKFTYVFKQNNRSHEKELYQRRVSQRLAQKSNSKNPEPTLTAANSRQKRSTRKSTSGKKNNEEEELNVDYLKQHIREINVYSSMMENCYGALTEKDKQIVKVLKQCDQISEQEQNQSNQESEAQESTGGYDNYVEPEHSEVSVVSVASVASVRSPSRSRSRSQSQTNSLVRRQELKKNLQKFKVEDIPMVISRIVDPDINNHGIYALMELGKISRLVHNAKYALTPITNLSRASRRLINEDYTEAKRQAGIDERDNLVYMKPTATILDLIKVEKEKRVAALQ